MHIAAKRGDVEIVRLLLQQAGADLNATDKKGCTPLLAACNVHASTVLFGRFFFFFFFFRFYAPSDPQWTSGPRQKHTYYRGYL